MLNDLGKSAISNDSLNKYNDKYFKGKKISKKDLYNDLEEED